MGVLDTASVVAKAIIPPAGNDPAQDYRWRVTIAALLAGVIVATSIHIAWACGYLAFVGLPGFASASELSEQNLRLEAVQQVQLTHDIRDLKKEQCVAITQKNQDALGAITNDLENLKETYRIALNKEPQVPRCYELLIGSTTTGN